MAASYLSKLNPVPGFDEYSGPYKVGTIDVEIPITELDSPAPAPANSEPIETVQFRVFYPTQPKSTGKRITWLPAPQRDHLTAYIKFLGIGSLVAQAVSFLPRHLHYTTIPVIKNAPILEPETPNKRWPTAIFSHGLGGSRNAYSQIVGSLASHGVVVICPEHRDGSAVASFVRIPSEQNRYFVRNTRRLIPYVQISHEASDEVYAQRCSQLRIRMWELGLIHDALLKIDKGTKLSNLNASTPNESMTQFANQLHIHDPGSIIFAGHSFGAATTVQFLKSVYYAGNPALDSVAEPLYAPDEKSAICQQITPKNVTILLDLWCFPLLAKSLKPLFDLPLPVYDDVPGAPGGNGLLAVESQDFYKWKEHLHVTAHVLSPDPSAETVEPTAYERPSGVKMAEPNFFYVHNSAHLNQSDFGVLFPWLTKKVFGSDSPERALRLNLRAILQVLRVNGVPGIARTWVGDLVEGTDAGAKAEVTKGVAGAEAGNKAADDGIYDDRAIFARVAEAGPVEAWSWIDIVGMGDSADSNSDVSISSKQQDSDAVKAQEPGMANRIEPQVSESVAVQAAMSPVAATS
ncbi:1-alkyl-2-acetylglycerophosphocholine esterase [Apiospora kogelbergensis]|uniref:1-alkyl-2-acetylglycerophosphocholine esterase n=1 Tax=Apiospora kogelbergensis TaxID=1337665 RepID=UPI00312EC559